MTDEAAAPAAEAPASETPSNEAVSIFDQLDMTQAEVDAPVAEAPAAEVPAADPTPAAATTAAPTAETSAPTAPAAPAAAPAATATTTEAERSVPLAALIAERRRAEALERELAAAKTPPAPAKPAEPEKPDPDFNDDPKGYVDAKLSRAEKALEALKTDGGKAIEETRQTAGEMRLNNDIAAAETLAAAKIPDYRDAMVHVREVRASQLALAHPDATPDQIRSQVFAEERAMAARELSAGRNPFEFVHRFAKTVGYVPKAPAVAAPAPDPAKAATDAAIKAAEQKGPKALAPDLTLGSSGAPAGADDGVADEDNSDDAVLRDVFAARGLKRRA